MTLTETTNLITSANSFAMKAKRKTLNAGDVMSAMEEMEFERFLPPLREALEGNRFKTYFNHLIFFSSYLVYLHHVFTSM